MKIDWSGYKITLLLYVGIILMLAGFYLTYTSFDEIRQDTEALAKLHIASEALLREHDVKKVDEILDEIEPWVKNNRDSTFFISFYGLEKEYQRVRSCNLQVKDCDKILKSFIFGVNNMILLKENRINNIFYINFAASMALLLLIIFLIRAYMYQQISKKALIDFKTKLYSRDYLLSTLKELCARQNRTEEKLSALYIKTKNIEDREYLLEHIGKAFIQVIRESDIACRYDENQFIVVFPNTSGEVIEKILQRIDENLMDIEYSYTIFEYDPAQSYEDFIDKLVSKQ